MLLLGIVQCTTRMAFHSSPTSKCQIRSTYASWMSAFCSAPGYTLRCKVFPSRDSLNMCSINWLCITLSLFPWNFLVSHILPQWKRLCSLETSPSLKKPTEFPSVPTSALSSPPPAGTKTNSLHLSV